MGIANPIVVRGLRKSYGKLLALRDIDLDVMAGEFLTLLGPSGSGKSTFLMVLAGFIRPEAGSIKVADSEILLVPPHKRNMGLVFQNYALFPHMSVAENIAFPLKYRSVSRSDQEARVRRALDTVRLSGLGERRPDQLSGGQRQRVAVARALVFEPAVLLMDEPLSALDKNLRESMQTELKELHDRSGTTTIYVTHDQREALTMSTRIAVMNEGHIVQLGSPEEVYERPCNAFVAKFLGDSQLIRVESEPTGSVRIGSQVLKPAVPLSQSAVPVYWLVRPEKIEIISPGTEVPEMNVLPARVAQILYQGDHVKLSLALSTGEAISLRRSSNHRSLEMMPRVDDTVTLGIHPVDTIVISAQ
jgi:putative spermidine/putrescine transport system ATP-binding protein